LSSERESRLKIKILENKKISFMEKFVGRKFGGRILFEMIFVFCRKRNSYRKSRKNPCYVLIQ
jgi:hypothetical protein